MTTKAKKYEVVIFGNTYALVSDESLDRIMQSAELIDNLMNEIAHKSRGLDTKKIAILAALQIAQELGSLQDACKFEQECQTKLIAKINDQLASV